jgi:peroxiredoxin
MSEDATVATRPAPIQPGDLAPEFTLPEVERDGSVSLADYRGRSPLFLALFIGLWCPFCRRAIAQMGPTEGKLKAVGVETLGIVASRPDNARLYFKYRPTRLRLAADPALSTHRAYGVPKPAATPELMEQFASTRINPTGEFPEPLLIPQAAVAIGQFDGYTNTQADQADMERQWPQLKGQFLIDREGIVRWVNIECAVEGLAGVGKFPTAAEILAAVRALPG